MEILSDTSKTHGDHESTTCRLRAPDGFCYLKIHQTASHWHNEVHAYEHWAGAFGEFAPRLLAVRDKDPLALVISELPGQIMEDLALPPAQEQAIWQAAGAAMAVLHELGPGEHFGRCWRDGTYAEQLPQDAVEMVARRFMVDIEHAIHAGYINQAEQATLRAAYELIPAFEGERPIPCHRDYCAANWLVSQAGAWAGVIDFEFAHWDVRAADFSRDPHWNWVHRPDLTAAFFAGYKRSPNPADEQQLLVAYAEYALGAILWGHENAFYGFEREGHEALAWLDEKMVR